MRQALLWADGECMGDPTASYSIVLAVPKHARVLDELTAPSLDEAWRIARSRYPGAPLALVRKDD